MTGESSHGVLGSWILLVQFPQIEMVRHGTSGETKEEIQDSLTPLSKVLFRILRRESVSRIDGKLIGGEMGLSGVRL
jgi:hypothetical protein